MTSTVWSFSPGAALDMTLPLLIVRGRRACSTGRLRNIRTRAGLSRETLAEALGIDPKTVLNWELHGREPRAPHAARLALLLDEIEAALKNDDDPAGTGSSVRASAGTGGGDAD